MEGHFGKDEDRIDHLYLQRRVSIVIYGIENLCKTKLSRKGQGSLSLGEIIYTRSRAHLGLLRSVRDEFSCLRLMILEHMRHHLRDISGYSKYMKTLFTCCSKNVGVRVLLLQVVDVSLLRQRVLRYIRRTRVKKNCFVSRGNLLQPPVTLPKRKHALESPSSWSMDSRYIRYGCPGNASTQCYSRKTWN